MQGLPKSHACECQQASARSVSSKRQQHGHAADEVHAAACNLYGRQLQAALEQRKPTGQACFVSVHIHRSMCQTCHKYSGGAASKASVLHPCHSLLRLLEFGPAHPIAHAQILCDTPSTHHTCQSHRNLLHKVKSPSTKKTHTHMLRSPAQRCYAQHLPLRGSRVKSRKCHSCTSCRQVHKAPLGADGHCSNRDQWQGP